MIDGNGDFAWRDDWQPDIRATLMFVVREGKILMIRKKRGIGAGKINGPGGKIDPGETALQCAVRETEEELCIRVLDPVKMGELSFSFQCGSTPEIHGHVFMASGYEGEPEETEEAIPLWLPVEEIPYDEMWDDDRYWLPHMIEGKKFKARFIFQGEKVVGREVVFLDDWQE